MSPNPPEPASCTECKRLNERITQLVTQLGMSIETLHQACENEKFTDSVAAVEQFIDSVVVANAAPDANGQTQIVIHGAANVSPPITDLADTLPWLCPNATELATEAPRTPRTFSDVVRNSGLAVEAPLPAAYWHRIGARPKTSTPARKEFEVVRRRGKPGKSSNKRAPMVTAPPELSLHNRYELLTRNEMCDNYEAKEANHTTSTRAKQSPRNSPKIIDRPRAGRNIANSTHKLGTILIGDTMTKHVKLAKTENLCLDSTSVSELAELLPTILTTRPKEIKIVIHTGSFDILRKGTHSEELKKDFTRLLNTLSESQSKDVFISGPIACFRRGQEIFSRLLSLNSWLTSACHVRGLRFIDNFNIFWNCADRFQPDGLHPNHTGSRLLGDNLRHNIETRRPNNYVLINTKDSADNAAGSPLEEKGDTSPPPASPTRPSPRRGGSMTHNPPTPTSTHAQPPAMKGTTPPPECSPHRNLTPPIARQNNAHKTHPPAALRELKVPRNLPPAPKDSHQSYNLLLSDRSLKMLTNC